MLSETFQVAAIIKKLTPAWKDFKSYLKHKRKELILKGWLLSSELRKITEIQKENGLFLWQRQMLLNIDLKIIKKNWV